MADVLKLPSQPIFVAPLSVRPVLLRSVRMWVAKCQTTWKVSEEIIDYWSAFGATAAAYYVDGLMWALMHGRKRPINIGSSEPLPDETTLLNLVFEARLISPEDTVKLLSDLLTVGAARSMHESSWRLRQVIATSSLLCNCRDVSTATSFH